MASTPSKSRPITGRIDGSGRLIAADSELEKLQREAGSEVGQLLALPQVAAVAQLARRLRTTVRRPAIAGSADQDIDLWVNATPEGDEVSFSLEGWSARPAAGPRLASILGAGSETDAAAPRNEWCIDEELRVISLSTEFAELMDVDPAEATGEPLTRILRLEEADAGDMPLMSALALRRDFSGQPARSRSDDNVVLLLRGELITGPAGHFAGFRGTAERARDLDGADANQAPVFDHALDELLRSPIDRIIESAERIVARADGPLSSDYAGYGNDIASAARHLLSVLEAMSDDAAQAQAIIDLAALASEAVIMLESTAEERSVRIDFDRPEPLRARGQERGVIQILVNLVGNAIRYSPEGATIQLTFTCTDGTASVTVSDQGPGVSAGDEQRIFERFERAHSAEGTGLGLAISRRLARSMGGDVTLDSAPGDGARFTLTLTAP